MKNPLKLHHADSPFSTETRLAVIGFLLIAFACQLRAQDSITIPEDQIRNAVSRSVVLLEKASAGSAENRECFTCHGQAMPVLALVEAKRRGFAVDLANLDRQIQHTHAHLRRGKDSYTKGKGQGGGVDTAGYALWTLEDGERNSDEVTSAVIEYLLAKQNREGFWKCSSDRPPSESSHITTTYLAVRALTVFSESSQQQRVADSLARVSDWIQKAELVETEDVVFGLLMSDYLDVPDELRRASVDKLTHGQRSDGGWAQKADMDSDAYATGSALYAQHRVGTDHSEVWNRGIRYLLDSQHPDGSWRVTTRSKPFQEYFETGFPHGKDQFISTSATAWATLALLFTLPEPIAVDAAPEKNHRSWFNSSNCEHGRLLCGVGTIVDFDQRCQLRGNQ